GAEQQHSAHDHACRRMRVSHGCSWLSPAPTPVRAYLPLLSKPQQRQEVVRQGCIRALSPTAGASSARDWRILTRRWWTASRPGGWKGPASFALFRLLREAADDRSAPAEDTAAVNP